jgi:hypothetical protein
MAGDANLAIGSAAHDLHRRWASRQVRFDVPREELLAERAVAQCVGDTVMDHASSELC